MKNLFIVTVIITMIATPAFAGYREFKYDDDGKPQTYTIVRNNRTRTYDMRGRLIEYCKTSSNGKTTCFGQNRHKVKK